MHIHQHFGFTVNVNVLELVHELSLIFPPQAGYILLLHALPKLNRTVLLYSEWEELWPA